MSAVVPQQALTASTAVDLRRPRTRSRPALEFRQHVRLLDVGQGWQEDVGDKSGSLAVLSLSADRDVSGIRC